MTITRYVPEASASVRSCFRSAVDGFAELVSSVPVSCLGKPALGSWSVRDLIGHASRALSTIENYCGRQAPGEHLSGPAAYFVAAGASALGSDARTHRDESIAERGKASGAALGDDPASAVHVLARRVVSLVDSSGDQTPMATAMGPMTLLGYLPTRTFELAVHSLDLATALRLATPAELEPAIAASLVLAAEVAAASSDASHVLLALCGRRPLPASFTVV